MKKHFIASVLLAIPAAMLMTAVSAAEIDADAAKKLAKRSDCLNCHAVDKTKIGPAYKKVALKYKGKADGEEKLTKFITTGPKVKLEDGTEMTHIIIGTTDKSEIKNLVNWILSQ